MNKLRAFWGGAAQDGQAIILVATMMTGLIGMVGLAVDAGQLFAARRAMQEAADAGAFAGAVVLYQAGTATDARTAAVADVARNGYVHGVGSVIVTVNSPPTSGAYSGNAIYVEVIIEADVETTLIPVPTLTHVRARGVAGSESLNSGYAVVALDTACTSGAISFADNQNVHLNGGGLLVNSCSSTAISGIDSNDDFTITPSTFGVEIVGTANGSTFPPAVTVTTGVTPKPDPFAGYPKPNGTSYNGVDTLPVDPAIVSGVAYEGVYHSTLQNVKLCHGIYILAGGGFGGDVTQQTTGTDPRTGAPCDGQTLIYNTTSNFPLGTGTCSDMGTGGAHPIVLAPMTTGPFAFMGIYQDPTCSSNLSISGNNQLSMGGTIYIPNGNITLNGNPSTIVAGQLIGKRVDVQNGNLEISYNAGTTAQPRLPRLAE